MPKIRVLVVDDSAFMRKIISQILGEDSGIEVAGTARDGKDALKKINELNPDVITLDVEMPGLGGLETLGYIMSEKPTPVIMLSAYTPGGAEITLRALEYGAVDFVCKPSGEISLDIKKVQKELLEKVKAAKKTDLSNLKFITPDSLSVEAPKKEKGLKSKVLVIIAASTGGPRALTEVVPKLRRNIPASFLVVQHMSGGFTKTLSERLDRQSLLKVKEAENGEIIEAGNVYVAPGNYHMEINSADKGRHCLILNRKPSRLGVRPCADITVFSAVEKFRGKIIEVVLTGMGRDGAESSLAVSGKKGTVIAQDEGSCVIYGMPKAVFEKGKADIVKPLGEIPDAIMKEIEIAAEKVK